jgi:uncharacterized protein (DUF302 family)
MTGTVSHANGLISVLSSVPFVQTVANLRIALERRGMTLHACIDHAANAAGSGLQLRPTQLFIFNYPEVEGALLARCPLMGLDMPRKFLVWEDKAGKVWLGYNDPLWLGHRYSVTREVQSLLRSIANSFTGIALEAGGIGAHARRI